MKTLVIIPTYNEADNITHLIPEILKHNPEVDILVVDDNSPDGTGSLVKKINAENKKVNLLHRKKKQGLGKAYLAGFSWGLDRGYELLVEMDADFSHRPKDLVELLKAAKKSDFAVGSRYIPGGAVVNWGWIRLFISRGGGFYARTILGFPLSDWTGGFNAWRRETLQGMDLGLVSSDGYCFQIELKYRASKKGFTGSEVPITFEDRKVGQSKMSMAIVLEAFYKVWLLRFQI